MATTEGAHVLTQGVGYGVVLGIGFVFALLMMGLSALQNRYTTFKIGTSEEFNTASRSVKPGLIASGIVSAWTWAATLLQSSTVTYEYGLCGGYYYAAGATLQIFLMAILAVRVKMIAPYCHTYLEIVQARYGNTPHFIFVTYGLVTNLIVSSMLLLGGSAVVNAFTGMNIYAANFLIPIGVMVYVILGGLRATFLCQWLSSAPASACAHTTCFGRRLHAHPYSHDHHSVLLLLHVHRSRVDRRFRGHVPEGAAGGRRTTGCG